MEKLLFVQVYRHGKCDCTNGGVTSKVDNTYLFHDCTKEQALEYCKETKMDASNMLILVRRELFGENADYVAPLVTKEGGTYMMGGNFVYSSDSRFSNACGRNPLPVHDRFETWAQYNEMSV